MLPRRQFLSSLAACFTVTGTVNQGFQFVLGNTQVDLFDVNQRFDRQIKAVNDLRWQSEVIETLPHNDSLRSPVVTFVAAQFQGDLLAVVGDDHVVSIYSRRSRNFIEHLKRHRDWVRTCVFSPDGNLLATAGNDKMLYLWRTDQWSAPVRMKRTSAALFDAAFAPDGSEVAVVGFSPTLTIIDPITGREINELDCTCSDVHAVDYSHDGRWLAAAGRDGIVRVWDRKTNTLAQKLPLHQRRVRSLQFTEKGELISASDDQFVNITNFDRSPTSRSLPRHPSKIYAVTSLDQDLIATAGSDNLIRIWNIERLEEVGILKGHTGTVTSLGYSQLELISASYDTRVRIWTTQQQTSIPQRTTDRSEGWNPTIK